MATITNASSVSAALSTAATQATASDEMDQTAFLKLFTTQLQNQNPLDPVKNEAFVAQLAQFSQLEATTGMADSLKSMATALQSDRLMTGASLIGKKVAPVEGTAELKDGANISSVLSLDYGASAVTLDVYNSAGTKVFTQALGRQAPGEVAVTWSGYDQNGNRMPAGRYNVIATVDSFGEISQVPITTPATVTSVTYSATAKEMVLGLSDGSTIPLSEVTRVDG